MAEEKNIKEDKVLPAPSPEALKPELTPPPEVVETEIKAPVKEEEVFAPAEEKPRAVSLPPVAAPKPAPLPSKDPVLAQVEHILEENLQEVYFDLPPEAQKKFHDKGDEVAGKIRTMLGQTKVKAKKILDLIRGWLKLIPGINKFFLEQEAKIKTDKMMVLAKYEKDKEKKS